MKLRPNILSAFMVPLLVSASAIAQTATPGSPPPPPVAPPAGPAAAPGPQQEVRGAQPERVTVPQPTPPPSAVPAPTPEELRRRRVSVQIDSTHESTVIERRISSEESQGAFIVLPFRLTQSTWEQVCVTPCSVDLDRFSTYRVKSQNHVSSSGPFTLPQGSDSLHLNVHAGSILAHHVGEAMTGIGIAAVIVGGSLLIAAPNMRHPDDDRIAGAITGGAGIALAAIGIPVAIATVSHVGKDSDREIADVYFNRGHEVPFLPNVDLGHGFTLTQRGIIF